ncbi:MAG: creatininase family protein [Chloroflexota bacterium]
MQWEQLTSPEFSAAVKETGVCIIAFGVLERHGDHLPIGTDFLNGHRLACLAAEMEAAVVFPPFYFGQIYEARCFPGTVTLKPTLLMDLVYGVMDEIGRNGFKKIILLNAHGGNDNFLPFITQTMLWEKKTYSVYFYDNYREAAASAEWKSTIETSKHGHACECETSISLANHADLVKMENISGKSEALGRLSGVPGNFSAVSWYADFPEHYAGDARTANEEKGRILRSIQVNALARFIQNVKKDAVVPALEDEFFSREGKLR